jgi:hypothetical protein
MKRLEAASKKGHQMGAKKIMLAVIVWTCLMDYQGIAQNDKQTMTVQITDKVLVKDTLRLGINHGEQDACYVTPSRKYRLQMNFEGGFHRWIFKAVESSQDNKVIIGMGKAMANQYPSGSTFTIISGSSKWTTGTVRQIGQSHSEDEGRGQKMVLELDQQVKMDKGDGIMLEHLARAGSCAGIYSISKKSQYVFDDVPSSSFGRVALWMKGIGGDDELRCPLNFMNRENCNRKWGVRFWAKAKQGKPTIAVVADNGARWRTNQVTTEWKQYETVLDIHGLPEEYRKDGEAGKYFYLTLMVSSGDVLIDDLEIWRAGEKNPTAFTDGFVQACKKLKPGVLRILQGSGNSVLHTIMPKLKSYNGRGGLHEFYGLCEEVGAEPYYCLPANMTRDEMKKFIEYLAAPADVGWGELRAELGHPRPWTETLPGINIEIGNETHNFGGFGGRDYWHDLIEAGKQSPYYHKKIFFTMGRQGQALMHAKNMDGFSIASYVAWGFSKEMHRKYLSTEEDLFKWAYTCAIGELLRDKDDLGKIKKQLDEIGAEMCMYEGNYHINFGDGPGEPRNKVANSIAGAVNYVNRMLMQIKLLQMRKQCYFRLIGRGVQFKPGSVFGSHEAGYVRIFGSILRLDKGEERYRPSFHALCIANEAIGGNLVETEFSGKMPSFDCTGLFPWKWGSLRKLENAKPETFEDIPLLWFYAFENGEQRSIILVNLDMERSRDITVTFNGQVKGDCAKRLSLKGDKMTSNNELDWSPDGPQVTVDETQIIDFQSGCSITIAPHSITTLKWEIETKEF